MFGREGMRRDTGGRETETHYRHRGASRIVLSAESELSEGSRSVSVDARESCGLASRTSCTPMTAACERGVVFGTAGARRYGRICFE